MKGRYSETQRKVEAILSLPEPPKKTKPIPVYVTAKNIISALENFDRKVEVAMYLSKNKL